MELFSDFPSYLATTLAVYLKHSSPDCREHFDKLMLTADFSQSCEVSELSRTAKEILQESIAGLFLRTTEWDDMKMLLTMIEVRHDKLGNENDYVPTPYFCDLRLHTRILQDKGVVQRVAKAIEVTEEVALEVLKSS